MTKTTAAANDRWNMLLGQHHLLLLLWWITTGLVVFGSVVAWDQGLFQVMVAADRSHICLVLLLMYAIGRNVQYYDAPALREIVRQSKPGNYKFSSLVLGVVKSVPFQMRQPLKASGK